MADKNISIKANHFHAFRCCLFSAIAESSSSVISGHCNKSSLKLFTGAAVSSFEGQMRTSTSSAVNDLGKVNTNSFPCRLIRVFSTWPGRQAVL